MNQKQSADLTGINVLRDITNKLNNPFKPSNEPINPFKLSPDRKLVSKKFLSEAKDALIKKKQRLNIDKQNSNRVISPSKQMSQPMQRQRMKTEISKRGSTQSNER